MIRYGIIATVFLLFAVAVTATFRSGETTESAASSEVVTSTLGQGDIQQRLAALEATVREEKQLRMQMEKSMAELIEQNQALYAQLPNEVEPLRIALGVNADGLPISPQELREQVGQRRNNSNVDAGERQMERLVEAGFDEYRAADIVRIQEEFQMALLNARFEASQTGERINLGAMQLEAAQKLKTSLGEDDYEKYLQATRQSTAVAVRNVLESSPGQLAGLQSGDEIIRYAGERVYNLNELNRLTNSPESTGSVLVEVMRDGQSISLSLPAGPIGITSGRGGF